MEFYVAKLARKYNIKLGNIELDEIINEVLDNVIKYYDIKKSPNLKAYMYTTSRGKFLNYFRDKIKDVKITSFVNDAGEEKKEDILKKIEQPTSELE
eukprot:NODE_2627_length_459_cov_183.314634_g2175_i0.p1 GENE.NODE_2627_length_459_cov_183.314634_g2175_i0~~NODE_2627_length_459_cov_183.314634_g2175_i0.p1  ORF type:complete len:97 (-),score=3.23 NODE_2627_length_459_cov_183.314634_g2175_i0:12-302(-)